MLNNTALINALMGHVDSTYIDLVNIQMELDNKPSIDTELGANTAMITALQTIENSPGILIPFRAKALLSFVADEIHQTEDFLPLSTRSSLPNNTETQSAPLSKALLYPNPSTGKVQILLEGLTNEKARIQLFDVWGALIEDQSFENQTQIHLDYGPYKAGTYFVKIFVNDTFLETKLLQLK